jgi:hypothetical protein
MSSFSAGNTEGSNVNLKNNGIRPVLLTFRDPGLEQLYSAQQMQNRPVSIAMSLFASVVVLVYVALRHSSSLGSQSIREWSEIAVCLVLALVNFSPFFHIALL